MLQPSCCVLDLLRDLRRASVHIRNGLYLYDRGDLSLPDLMRKLPQVAGDADQSTLGELCMARPEIPG